MLAARTEFDALAGVGLTPWLGNFISIIGVHSSRAPEPPKTKSFLSEVIPMAITVRDFSAVKSSDNFVALCYSILQATCGVLNHRNQRRGLPRRVQLLQHEVREHF
jgi:hypothetical protein